jgi:hypothetical protein
MTGFLVANGIPLAPSLGVRLLALLVIEAALLLLVVLLYMKWVQLKNQPLDEWWERRKAQGLSRQTLYEIQESERERLAAQGGAPPERGAPGSGGEDATREG